MPVPHAIEVVWEGGLRYSGGREGGRPIVLEGGPGPGPGPVDSLMVALAACSSMDVVEILAKRRTPVTALRVRASFARAAEPPRRITEAHLVWYIATESERPHIERAIALSMRKYCSVAATFAPDVELTWDIVHDR